MTKLEALKKLIKKIAGIDAEGGTIADLLDDAAEKAGGAEPEKAKVTDVVKVRPGTEKTFNKQISTLMDGVTLSEGGELSGTLKKVEDFDPGSGAIAGWFLALHVDNTKLSSEDGFKMGIGTLSEPDKRDWNYTFSIDEEKKQKKIRIEIGGKTEYEIGLSGLTLSE